MTFSEAAVEVLKTVGKPLHYKRITVLAIEKNLLSHVGKSPEVTMSARLAALVTRDKGEAPIIRLAPGIFGLRDWGDAVPVDQAELDEEVAAPAPAVIETLPDGVSGIDDGAADEPEGDAASVQGPPETGETPAETEPTEIAASPTGAADDDDDDDEWTPGEEPFDEWQRPLPEPTDAPAGARSEEELDLSDEYVRETFKEGGPEGAAESGQAGEDRSGVRRGRRRRRRGRGRGNGEGGEARPPVEGEATVGREREPRDPPHEREPREREPRDAEGGRRSLSETIGELVRLLTGQERSAGVPVRQLVDMASKRRLVPSGVGNAVLWMQAILRADNARRLSSGRRPRFRPLTGGRWALWEWGIGGDAADLGLRVEEAADRQRDATRRKLHRKLAELPAPTFEQIVVLLLGKLGYGNVDIVGRVEGETHFVARERRGVADVVVAVVGRRDQRELTPERVAALRGVLHRFEASQGWILTTGPVSTAAREEAGAPVVAQVVVTDGLGLGRLCQEQGVGVCDVAVRTTYLDLDFFDSLKV